MLGESFLSDFLHLKMTIKQSNIICLDISFYNLYKNVMIHQLFGQMR